MRLRKENFAILISIIITIAAITIYIMNMGNDSFGADELFSIGVVNDNNTLKNMFDIFIFEEVTNPPLYDIFLYFWYRLVPSTEIWLLLPNIMFFEIGMLALYRIISKTDKYLVIILTITAWINVFNLEWLIYNLRSYAMLFMFSSLVLYQYLRARITCNRKNAISLCILMTAMAFTHYYGVIVIVGYLLIDLAMVIKKKISSLVLLPHIVSLLLVGLYLALTISNRHRSILQNWVKVPSIKSVYYMFLDLLGKYNCVLMAAIFVVFVLEFIKTRKNELLAEINFTKMVIMWICAFVTISTFIYSAVMNPKGSIFVPYYFLSIRPHLLLLYVYAISSFIDICIDRQKQLMKVNFCFVVFVFSFGGTHFDSLFRQYPIEREAAKYILTDLENDSNQYENVVICLWDPEPTLASHVVRDGWIDFYLRNHEINIVDTMDDFQDYDRVYFWYGYKYEKPEKKIEYARKHMDGFDEIRIAEQEEIIVYQRR